jgi:hypothetical protein
MNFSHHPMFEAERAVLREFFERVSVAEFLDNSISDSKFVKHAQKQMKQALSGLEQRCTCAKCKYTMCEVCQGSDPELYHLRNFYRNICKAKQLNYSIQELQAFIESTTNHLNKI